MSGGVNVKSAPRSSLPSGIPLPRSLLLSSPKMDPRHRTRVDHQTLTSNQTTATHSVSLVPKNSSSPFSYCGALNQAPTPSERNISPLSKIVKQAPHDGNHNRNTFTNENQRWSPETLGSRENSGRDLGQPENQPDYSELSNYSNLRPSVSLMNCESVKKRHVSTTSQSDEEMGTSDDSSPIYSPRPPLLPTPITFKLPEILKMYGNQSPEPVETHPPKVNMATVAPFSYRLQDNIFSVDELSDCSSGSIEVCCDDLIPGGMLEAIVDNISMTAKPTELKTRTTTTTTTTAAAAAHAASCPNSADLQTMASRKPTSKPSALPQGPSRPLSSIPSSGSELTVYRSSSGSIPVPVPNPSGLRKQRSLSNLFVLTDAEKKLHLYQSSRLGDSTGKSGTGADKPGQTKTCQGGKTTLSRTLSKSEQSLFQGKSKPVGPTAGKQSKIPGPGKPRGPYAEVKPISKTCQVEQKADRDPEDHLIKINSHVTGNLGKKPGEKVRSASLSTEEKKDMPTEEDKNFLKVDPELVVTVLGDLEQLLFSQMLDPESQRKRTVQNVLDLRQNLEETMTSLRGAQLSQSCLEGNTCYDSDEAAAFSISTLSNRSSPLSWRQGQASPRLQAGEAPSSGNAQPDVQQRSRHIMSRIHLVEDLDDADTSLLKGGYLSDSDAGGRSPNEAEDDDDDDDDDDEDLGNGWDESSSISSGLSDGSDNLSCEDFNSSTALNSLPSTPVSSRRSSNILMRTDAEKRSLVENGLCWDNEDSKSNCKNQGSNIYDTGSPKSEPANRWKKSRPQGDGLDGGGRGELKKPQTLGQNNVLKKGRNQPVGVTSPITHTTQSGLKVAGSIKSDMKPMDKSRLAVKSSGLQRSSSDAGKDHRNGTSTVEQRKPPSGLVRPSAGGNFGFKKPNTAANNGVSINGTGTGTGALSSSTVSKTPKTSGIPVKPAVGGSGGRKISLDVSSCDQSGFLSPSARTSLQYRSLPRPAKTSTLTLTRPSSARPVSTTGDTNSGLTKPSPTTAVPPQGSRLKEPAPVQSSGPGLSKPGSRGIPSPGPVNQTDREKEKERAKAKAVMSDSECGGGSLKGGSTHSISEKLQGLRPPSGGKSLDRPATNIQRLSGVRSLGKPQSVSQVNSNSLDMEVQGSLPPKIPPYSKLQDLANTASSSSSSSSSGSHLTPSPAPLLTVSSSACFSSSGSGLGPRQVSSLESSRGSSSPPLYPRLSGLHRSMESLPLQMSLPPENWEKNREGIHRSVDPRTKERQEDTQRCPGIGGRVSLTLPDTSDGDRNTLPKKGLSFISSQPVDTGKERGERRHSHTVFSVGETLALPILSSPTSLPRSSRTGTAASSPVSGAPRMTRSNSIPAHEGSVEAYVESPLGSTLSLSERPRSIGMVRSGSFRDRDSDEVHGSVLSLASNASSTYSSAEERIQGEQIRKLRRELESSQEKVSALTTQLTANANLVAAFEQSLALMTTRLQSLSMSHEQKDNELMELRETIDSMKERNEEAQAVIHGALNNQDNVKDLQMRRQNSCESISSLNSLTSMSSVGSLKDQDAKKKKKKSWLRSSFNKAFSIKKGSKTYSDIEEIATPDSSAPNSPKMLHEGGEGEDGQASALNAFPSVSSSVIAERTETEEGDSEDTSVSDLRSELWVKERELTDIRLEALNSAHQLEQLRDAMNNMQSMVENLKAENSHLKTGNQLHSQVPGPATSTSQPSGLASLVGLSLKQPISMSLTKSFSLSLNDTKDQEDPSHVDVPSVSSTREDVCARVLVHSEHVEGTKVQQEFYLGTVLVNTKTDWASLDSLILKTFKDYLIQVDPIASLGLSSESVLSYQLTHGGRQLIGGEDKPQVQPLRCLGSSSASIYVTLKGLKENCVDSLVFETLIPKPMMQHYISLLLKHRRLVLSGSSGTGKTFLAQRLALYLLQRSSLGSEQDAGFHSRSNAVTFNMHHQTQKELQLYLTNVANNIDQDNGTELPLVVIIDDINEPAGITELVNAALTCKYHKCPYIIGTTNQPVKMTSNNGLHMSFRMVTFSNNVEPANGFLLRYLHRKAVEAHQEPSQLQSLLSVLDWVPQLWYHLHTFLEKHSTSDFLIGPCFFLSCPVTMKEFRHWFIDLWNNSIIPYLQEGAKDGMKVHGQRAVWEDPVEWVRGTLPWPNAQQDQSKLFHLPPPSVTAVCCEEKKLAKATPPATSLDTDPLMAMLLKLQESANYIESPEQECVDPSLQTTL